MKKGISIIVVTAGIALAGCYQEIELVGEDWLASGCPLNECGANTSTLLDNLQFNELHLFPGQNTGQLNPAGVRISNFIAPDGSSDYTLRVHHGRLIATRPGQTLKGGQLIGGKIVITDTVNQHIRELKIHNHDTRTSWTSTEFEIDRYVFIVNSSALGNDVPACWNTDDQEDSKRWAVLVSRERYQWDNSTVMETGVDAAGWFNIACADTAIYKMKMMGYDPDPRPQHPFSTMWEDRQATLKMLTADYCGSGTSHTDTGTAVRWRNVPGWSYNYADPSPDVSFEARWNLDGATCLDTPRMGVEALPDIQADCAAIGRSLPPCDQAGTTSSEWTTHSPD